MSKEVQDIPKFDPKKRYSNDEMRRHLSVGSVSDLRKAFCHVDMTPDLLSDALDSSVFGVKLRAIAASNENMTESLLWRALHDCASEVQIAAVLNKNATLDQLMICMQRGTPIWQEPSVRLAIVSRRDIDPESMEKLLLPAIMTDARLDEQKGIIDPYDPDLEIMHAAIDHPDITPRLLLDALRKGTVIMRQQIVSHTKADLDLLLHGLLDEDYEVASRALLHDKVTPALIDEAMERHLHPIRAKQFSRILEDINSNGTAKTKQEKQNGNS
jgi:hypothetical protein